MDSKAVPTCRSDIHASEIIHELPQAAVGKINSKDGAFRFAAYGCALLERQTPSGMYVYTAANYETGKTEILSRRKKQLDVGCFEAMAAKISASSVCGDTRMNSDKKPGESVTVNAAGDTTRQIFTEILPQHGYAVREKQIELSEHILDVIGKRGVTLAESEVGTGKTHAYLVSAALAKRGRLNDFWLRGICQRQGWAVSAYMPVVVSTSSIALQKAIVTDYIPELSRILIDHGVIKEPLTAVIRKGKEHFVCERNLSYYMTVAESAVKKRLADFVGATAPFDLTEAAGLTPYIKRQIGVFGKCGDNCPYLNQCRYMKYLKRANDLKVDFQITNHNYLLADTLRRAGGRRSLLPNYQMVIIDEAHKFLTAARSMYGMKLTNGEITALAKSVHRLEIGKSNSGLNIHKLTQKLDGQGKRLFRRLNESIPAGADDETNRFIAVIDTKNARHLKNIIAIAKELSVALADSRVAKRFAPLIPSVIRRLAYINEKAAALKQHERLIYWLEKSDEPETGECQSAGLDTLFSIPKDLDSRLYRDLWSRGSPIVLTSGTLSASGDFTRVKETLGLQHLPERRLFSASMTSLFDYKNNALIYISESVPFPDNKGKRYITSVADEIERLVIAAHGHAAVLFTSYNAMGQVHAILSKRNLPFPLFRLERGDTFGIEQFKQSGNGILLASGALWEGIDIPGDALSLLIIIKLPFAVPDPIGDYEKSLYGSMEIYKTLCVIPDMLVKNKQGFGRAIRTERDTAVIAMLDCRLREGAPYRGVLLASLPPCRVTSRIGDIKNFIEEKKSADYFSARP